VDGAVANLQELQRSVETIFEETEIDQESLVAMRERYSQISSLMIKYRKNVNEIIAYANEIEAELDALENMELSTQKLQKEKRRIEQKMAETAALIRQIRQAQAPKFEQLVEQYLAKLNMETVQFKIALSPYKNGLFIDGHYVMGQGSEQVEFLISTMAGAPPQPLRQIASGGEISRVMLALKSALRGQMPTPILIFDEIDAGIGGQAAEAVGRVLAELAESCQLFCITHQPTLAVYAQSHFVVEKKLIDNETVTTISSIQGNQKIDEIARMLSGNAQIRESRKHAQALLAKSKSPD